MGLRKIRGSAAIVRVTRVAFLGVAATCLLLTAIVSEVPKASAAADRLGTPQVTLNPGGGILANGTDGLRFTVNADTNYDIEDYDYAREGQDGVVYRSTYQYCCSAGGPMLNVGGTLYGQSGPAYSSANWSSIEIVSTSGVASVGSRTSATGDSGATIRYTINHGGRDYIVERMLSYSYPNDFVTDSYSIVIPDGNTEQVKFYLGGDTAPGSSDSGYGIMLTSPVRSVISLNTYSQIMYGFREVQGSRTFDGATSQHYSAPFSTVRSGGDIGFVETASQHDAGLMMQWSLGTTPGTYTGSLEQFATLQGTNLNATLAESYSEIAGVVDLNISIVNSELDPYDGLGYTITLPNNLLIQDDATSSCGGTLTATVDTGVITLGGVSIGAASNCVVSLPVTSSVAGSYSITQASATDLTGVLVNNVGTSTLNVGVYPLSYATQGGTGVQNVSLVANDTTTIPTTTRAGYTFIEWNTAPDGSGTSFAPGATFTMPAAATTIYARWQYIPYAVIYDERGGDAVADNTNLPAGTDVMIPEISRDGYVFIEWNTSPDGSGTSYSDGDIYTVPVGGVTLHAIWVQQIALHFDGQDGVNFHELSELAGTPAQTPNAPSERAGYTFIEWNTSPRGTGIGYPENSSFTTPDAETTYYAIWEDSDGVDLVTENAAPNNGDANNDGVPDSQQANVTSMVNTKTGNPVTISAVNEDGPCFFGEVTMASAEDLAGDARYTYPYGMLDFTVDCGDPGFTATITQYFYESPAGDFVLRKFANGQFTTIEDATFQRQSIDGRDVLVVTYSVRDGGPLDEDGLENGVVVDPAGPALIPVNAELASGTRILAPNTGIAQQSEVLLVVTLVASGILGLASIVPVRRKIYDSLLLKK